MRKGEKGEGGISPRRSFLKVGPYVQGKVLVKRNLRQAANHCHCDDVTLISWVSLLGGQCPPASLPRASLLWAKGRMIAKTNKLTNQPANKQTRRIAIPPGRVSKSKS